MAQMSVCILGVGAERERILSYLLCRPILLILTVNYWIFIHLFNKYLLKV